eukprot:TRINITY_DN83187_c0_g1_i1.p1 TRINITY_DN83187_c0_g1~~TRINITY_DN83187_c0_g1_i1.p1  ORF type:complete len:111 (+),score=11.50 TRINITY_DN83187_c0_g1_i1:26-334(+)
MADVLGRYSIDGSVLENLLPYFKSENGRYYITLDMASNPMFYFVQWDIAETFTGYNSVIRNSKYTEGINCPWDFPDGWEYSTSDGNWIEDPTLIVECVDYRK